MRAQKLLVAAAVAAVLGGVAVSGAVAAAGEPITGGAAAGGAATAPAEPIKIGAIFSVTGPASFLGAPEEKTVKMVADQVNAAGGVAGRQIEVLIRDSAANPQQAISLAKQLIEEDHVFAIVGPSTSGESMQVKGICNDAKTILISCAAAEGIVDPVLPYVFKTPQTDSDAVRRIFETMNALKITTIGVTSSNTGFGSAGKAQLEKIAPEYGITIAISEVYDKSATDLTSVVTKIKAQGVQAVVNWSIEPAQAIIAKNMRQIGFDAPLFQSHGFGNILYAKEAGAAAEGIIFPAGRLLVASVLPDDHPQKALLVRYTTDYKALYGEDVSTFGGHAYDAMVLLLKAIEVSGGDREQARAALEGITGLVGTAGIFNLSPTDHNGLNKSAFEMLTVRNGAFAVYVQK
jgi:branched-chain amino acid transport system substrate-binding protein